MVDIQSKKRVFNSIESVDRELFPTSTKKKMLEKPMDYRNLGIIFAKESFKIIEEKGLI